MSERKIIDTQKHKKYSAPIFWDEVNENELLRKRESFTGLK